jgi:arylsulfatase A-like enzyme
MRLICIVLTVLLSAILTPMALAAGKARHVVVIVWDGMRPDFITPTNTPTLYSLAHEGVWFANHHPVFLSVTEPNGTSIATGAYPGHHGVFGDKDFRPDLNPLKPIHPEDFDTVRKSDAVTHGHHVEVPTVAELLHKQGMKTVIAGSKPIALLQDRAERPAGSPDPALFAGRTLPPELLQTINDLHGPFPSSSSRQMTRNDWTTQAMIGPLWAKGVPEFSLLWLNEPDSGQHDFGPGSARALAAIKNNDDNLARVLQVLEAKGARKETDIMVVSDHGFSTIRSSVDLAESLSNAGLKATREFKTPPTNGDIMVVGNGGSTFLYVIGHDKKVIADAVKFLQGWSFTGVIFAKQPMEGTFALSQVHLDSPTAPDIIISFRWDASANEAGTPGMVITDVSGYKPGQGNHGSLSPFEMHNTFIAAGPDFRAGVVDHLPTGNVDIAPTALWILGLKPPKSMDGRVVTEALTVPKAEMKTYEPSHLEATSNLSNSVWHQYLNFSEVNGVDYYDEGNGYQTPK